MGFLEKTLNFFKIAKCGKFLLECVSNGFISLKCPSAFFQVFLAKNQKNLKMEQLEIMMKKQSTSKKKRFYPSKRHL